jgi:hypothetical protein
MLSVRGPLSGAGGSLATTVVAVAVPEAEGLPETVVGVLSLPPAHAIATAARIPTSRTADIRKCLLAVYTATGVRIRTSVK